MYKACVITVSDKGACGQRADLSGPVICDILKEFGYDVIWTRIVPDEREMISALLRQAVASGAVLVLTTGGTGFGMRDVTPEATMDVIERPALGIAEAIRANSMRYTERAMLSRGVAGIAGKSLIVNLPGSPRAVEECLRFVLPPLAHGLAVLVGDAAECARKN